MLFLFLPESLARYIVLAGIVFTFVMSYILILKLQGKLPTDQGRAFAVNAEAAKGKPRGAGIIFVSVFIAGVLVFLPLSIENAIYCVLLFATMMSGFLDDASRIPWQDYKKGAIDLVISFLVSLTFVLTNSSEIDLLLFSTSVVLPTWLYVILGTILVWVSINITNCTDGVDGLSSSLAIISIAGFACYFNSTYTVTGLAIKTITTTSEPAAFIPQLYMLGACLLAYLIFNCSPSTIMMGDAGSRFVGVFFALAAMKSQAPFLFIPICLVFILDGGLGLIKIALKRFLKINFFPNVRMPLHDHARKVLTWKDQKTVTRFCIFHLIIVFLTLYILVL